jgi:hypothetical protein
MRDEATRNRGQRIVVALFRDREDATSAIRELHGSGFSREQIGVAMRDRSAEGRLVEETGTSAVQGAAAGAVGGGVLGGLVGLLVGIGAIAIPGIGPVVAGGALASALGVAGGTAAAGAGIGAATGGILGALVGLGVPHDEAQYFERGFREGGIIVSVDPAGREADARDILQAHDGDLGGDIDAGPMDDLDAVPVDGIMAGAAASGFDAEGQDWVGEERRAGARGRRRTDR